MKTRTWKNVKGMATVDFDPANPLRVDLPGVPETGNLEIPFISSGYDAPGVMAMYAEDSCPPESEDYREPRGVATVYFHDAEGKYQHINLTDDQTADIFEEYIDEIGAAELG